MDMQREYDNRGKVPEAPAILEGWGQQAAIFRGQHPHAELGVAYGPGERTKLDVFWPGSGRDGPIAIFVHGGYWQMLDRTLFSHCAAGLLGHGVAVAMPSYDLCPAVSLATIVEEVRDAAAFLHARHHRAMLAIGHSAGGHLAAMLLATDWTARALPAGLIHAAMPISGLFDLLPLLQTTVNDKLQLDAAAARRLSPVQYPRPVGRLHALVGGTEGVEYTRQAREIAAVWGGTWEAVPDANHFTIIEPLADPASPIVRAARNLLAA